MAPPIKPLFAPVPSKVYAPSKPLFASEDMEFLSISLEELALLNSDLNIDEQQLKSVQSVISKMNMKSANFNFIDDIGIGNQLTIPRLSDWTARTSTGKLFVDTRASTIRLQQLTSRGVGVNIATSLLRNLFRASNDFSDSDVSREVEWLTQSAPQRSELLKEIAEKTKLAVSTKIGLAGDLATCRGLLSKGKTFQAMTARAEGRFKSLQVSYTICLQLIGQLGNLSNELKNVETSVRTLSLNLVPAWDINRSMKTHN